MSWFTSAQRGPFTGGRLDGGAGLKAERLDLAVLQASRGRASALSSVELVS